MTNTILTAKGIIAMRKHYTRILKAFFARKLFQTRMENLKITQEDMASHLSMSCRSYVDLEHGNTSCSAVTLARFPLYLALYNTKQLRKSMQIKVTHLCSGSISYAGNPKSPGMTRLSAGNRIFYYQAGFRLFFQQFCAL